MQNIHSTTLKHGYLTVSKELIIQLIESKHAKEGELEAFLKILMKANYSETTHNVYRAPSFTCNRGECVRTYRSWSKILHWSAGKTYRFFQQLHQNGWIEIIPHTTNAATLHFRINSYDAWLGTPDPGKPKKKAVNEQFGIFWNQYHEITLMPKENIAKAQREWKKLSDHEQQLAIDHIEDYYMHLNNIKFTQLACSYLANKAFLNEYLD